MKENRIHIDKEPIIIKEYMGKIGRYELYLREELGEVDCFWFDVPTTNELELRNEVIDYFNKNIKDAI